VTPADRADVTFSLVEYKLLPADECQEVSIDNIRVRGWHPVRQSGIRLQRPMLQKLDRPSPCGREGANLIVLAIHHQDRAVDDCKIVVELGLGKHPDAFPMGNCGTQRLDSV
jgi:hypothetical protein